MDPRLTRGIDAFNAGRFFAAHEVWEDLWLDSVGAEKRLVQGLVQVAAGYLKAESGVHRGALTLLQRGVGLLGEFFPVCCGMRLAAFVEQVHDDVARLRTAAEGLTVPPALHAPQLDVER